MKIILLSGGSGKRLWPLSNDSRSKQFLQVLPTANGNNESMVQRVWRQLEFAGLQSSSYIATSRFQVELLHNQLGGRVPIITEPERRDTFPAIALAAAYLYSVEEVSLDEVVTIMPVDPYVEAEYFEKIKQLESILACSEADLALIGVKPTYPSTKYGYIVPEVHEAAVSPLITYRQVRCFREKPLEEQAAQLMEDGALWNCGVFAFKLEYIIQKLVELGLPIHYGEMVKQYKRLPEISFDYEVVEKAGHVVVTPYDGDWRDLGTWNTLTEKMDEVMMGEGTMRNCEGTHVINELDIPITVMGLTNVVVVTSPDGILVSEKSVSPQIKEVLKHTNQRPMYEERRWGRYRVIDYLRAESGHEVLTKKVCVNPGQNLNYGLHRNRSEVWTIIYGEGEFIMNEKRRLVRAGDVLNIPAGNRHSIRALSQMEWIAVQSGMGPGYEEEEQICTAWIDIVQKCGGAYLQ